MRFGASVVGQSLYRARAHVTAAFRGTRHNMHIKHLPTGCDKQQLIQVAALINYCVLYCISSNNSNWVKMLGLIPFLVIRVVNRLKILFLDLVTRQDNFQGDLHGKTKYLFCDSVGHGHGQS